jgi:Ca2+-binding EF-hand superfamily protein
MQQDFLELFRDIDADNNGKIDKTELQVYRTLPL